ncbi:MFS transporter [Alicyclobacillus tolerans]|uniref:MFS transporter n=1 Tax=Alicyclobacillus tolerans TaxID=90970 RepID=UPI001F41B437|nr:MFS transporter [Alicyclobacillus tolerans]MCF8567965.1 MFS transporter [Alicyclobacillus tolerans]
MDSKQAGKSVGTLVLVLVFFAWLIDFVDRLVISVALPFIGKTLHINAAEEGVILSVFFFAYAIMQIPGGYVVQRWGTKPVMSYSMGIWSVFTALTAVAGTFFTMIIVRILFGVFEGIFPPASGQAIGDHIEPEKRAKAFGIMLSSNTLGTAIAPLVAAPLIMAVGWQHAFFWVAGLGLVLMIIIIYLLPKKPTIQRTKEQTTAQHSISFSQFLARPTAWKAPLMLFGLDIVAWGITTWLPSYLLKVRHLSLISTGIEASLPFFAGTIAMVFGGWLFDRYFTTRQRAIIIPTQIICAIFLLLMFYTSSSTAFLIYEILAVFFMYLGYMAVLGIPVKFLPDELVGPAYGLINFGGQVAAFLSPLVIGLLISATGGSYQLAFWWLVFGAILCAAMSLWTPQSPEKYKTDVFGTSISL